VEKHLTAVGKWYKWERMRRREREREREKSDEVHEDVFNLEQQGVNFANVKK
jgi:hypothetical protein